MALVNPVAVSAVTIDRSVLKRAPIMLSTSPDSASLIKLRRCAETQFPLLALVLRV